ncbi:immunoglobulin-like domain-containing protein [Planococcus sp. X10-3]|uniref:immunoglobulin-like domain-containing protein n=1 Tax=Planococcus sp. X10-3 TaxID=3061240 RepID=UPI003BB19326
MRSMKLLLFLSIIIVLLTACIGQDPTTLEQPSSYGDLPSEFQEQDVSIQISSDQESYSLPVKQLHLIIENTGSTELVFGSAIYLEKLEDDGWYQIPYKNMAFTDIGILLAPGGTHLDEVPVDQLHYQLQEGTYRIVKEFYNESQQTVLAAEFEIE